MTTRPDPPFPRAVTKACRQACLIVAAAAALGLLVNALRPQGLALVRPPAVSPPSADSSPQQGARPIRLAAALKKLKTGRAIFIDARSEDDYLAGHIKTARSLPEKTLDIWMPDFFNSTPPETELVTYCGGPRCHLAEQLAVKLYAFGYPHVHHMTAGWDGWLAAGYPTETGL